MEEAGDAPPETTQPPGEQVEPTSEKTDLGAPDQQQEVVEIEEAIDAPPEEDATGKEANDGGHGAVSPISNEEAVPEKLQDEDAMKDRLWERVLYGIFPMLRKVEERRILRANDRLFNTPFKYAKNQVTTSKYNIITFLPINLFEQFLRVANVYFLILLIIQLIPSVASVPFYTTLLPLVFVLGVTAVKDAFDDIKRHVSDWKLNHRVAHVMGPDGELHDVYWQNVQVGDVLLLQRDEFITADMLLLSSSEPNSLVYIETAELDGETNLKVRQPLPETAVLADEKEKLCKFDGEVECEPPNNRLHKFVGTILWDGQKYSLDNEKILLRGCRLRNTKWMYGLVIYAGHDTKLVQNSGRTKFKRTHLDLQMNRLVIFILLFLAGCLLICLIGSLIYEFVYGADFVVYIPYFNRAQDNPAELAFLQILSNLVVLNTFVPISLYVSVEVIRLGLSQFINWDRKMYYEPVDVPPLARTTSLNEELGQIEYIFSDKTGTLTQNLMTFHQCTIKGVKYGEISADDKDKEQVVATGVTTEIPSERTKAMPERIDFTVWNSYADPDFVFYDQTLVDKCHNRDPDCDEFFKLLCLCHTVLPAIENDVLVYNAQSPDEAALVSAARNFGYVFKARNPFTITVDTLNRGQDSQVEYEILNILDFNNERKRMSVIVKYEGKITLYCKGADTIVFARLNEESRPLMETTLKQLGEYAREGLRTLVLAKKDLTEEEYSDWAKEYYEASILQENRDQAVDIVYSKIEQQLTLMGATAIEDKLQDGVPETIANLAKANIKIWVLTGDKQETAINIGYSSKLLTENMRVFIVDEDTAEGVKAQLQEAERALNKAEGRTTEYASLEQNQENEDTNEAFDDSNLGPPFGIVLNGHSLRHALKEDVKLQLLETAGRCSAVICCRVTPLQKKRVVDLVKKNKDAVTLAIGDGANDVGMIKAAHIGVGISGREGQQAVLASDFSFGQFRFLERLLLVHGRWSYHRMTTFLRYFFYKNFAFAFSQFLFAFFCGFTAQTLYDPSYIAVYNVIYTSLPVVVLAILDQDVDENNCYRFPELYIAGQQNKSFNPLIFIRSLCKGIYVAFVFFFILLGLTFMNSYPGGYEWDYQSFSVAASGALTIIVNGQIALDTFHWNPIMHVVVWGSMLSWFVVIPITSTPGLYNAAGLFYFNGVAYEVISSALFWFYLFLAVVIALVPTITFRICRLNFFPNLIDDVRLKQKQEGRTIFRRKLFHRKPPPDTPIQRTSIKRTGYAFAHTEGYGDMISTGQIFGMDEAQVEEERYRRLSQYVPDLSRRQSPVDGALLTAAQASISVAAPPVVTIEVSEESSHHVEPTEEVVKKDLEVINKPETEGVTPANEDEDTTKDDRVLGGGEALIEGGQDETDSAYTPGKFRINLPGSVDSPPEGSSPAREMKPQEEEPKSTEGEENEEAESQSNEGSNLLSST